MVEAKNEGIKFMRIDADLTDDFLGKTSKKAREEMDEQAKTLDGIFKKALKKEKITTRRLKKKLQQLKKQEMMGKQAARMERRLRQAMFVLSRSRSRFLAA